VTATGKTTPSRPGGAVRKGATRSRLRSPDRKLAIIQAAQETFMTLGADGASMKRIAKTAGVNAALLYQHFESNLELFEAAMVQPLEQLVTCWIDDARERAESGDGSVDSLLAHSEELLGLLLQATPMIGVVIFSDKFPGREFYTSRVHPLITAWIGDELRKARSLQGRDLTTTTSAMFGIYFNVAQDAHWRGVEVDVPKVAARLHDIVSGGLFESPTNRSE
jgi:AcrR family transcriptional regulator